MEVLDKLYEEITILKNFLQINEKKKKSRRISKNN
jgi:hypothetical protein